MKEINYVPVPKEDFYELKVKAGGFDLIGHVAANHPEHLAEYVREVFGITEEGKEHGKKYRNNAPDRIRDTDRKKLLCEDIDREL